MLIHLFSHLCLKAMKYQKASHFLVSFFCFCFCNTLKELYIVEGKSQLSSTIYYLFFLLVYYASHIHIRCPLLENSVCISYYFISHSIIAGLIALALELAMKLLKPLKWRTQCSRILMKLVSVSMRCTIRWIVPCGCEIQMVIW